MFTIGNAVRRPGKTTKWHLVESTVADAAFTKCGRRMERENRRGELEVAETMPFTRALKQTHICSGC